MMVAATSSFVKFSPEYSRHIKQLLRNAGFPSRTVNTLTGILAELGGWLYHGQSVRTTLGEVEQLIERCRTQVFKALKKLATAGIIEKISHGCKGIALKLLVRPDNLAANSAEPGEAKDAATLSQTRRQRAVELRLDEIEQGQGFHKSRAHARSYLLSNMSESEITEILEREEQRLLRQAQAAEQEAQRQQSLEAEKALEHEIEAAIEELPEDERAMLEERAESLLPSGLRRAPKHNRIRQDELDKFIRRLLRQDLIAQIE